MVKGANCIIIDCETELAAEDCLLCHQPRVGHEGPEAWCHATVTASAEDRYLAIGWDRKHVLGLSLGCYHDYQDMALHWFDRATLLATVQYFLTRQPLLVSFNGLGFDYPLMRAVLREDNTEQSLAVEELCVEFKAFVAASYDILATIWDADPQGRKVRGLNGLDAVSQANGFGAKLMDAQQAAHAWAQGRYAEVIAYNVDDVLKTKALFELILDKGGLFRGDERWLALPGPMMAQPMRPQAVR